MELDWRTKTQGVVLCFQVRTLDLNKRHASFVEKAPKDIVDMCNNYLHRVTDDIY